MLARDDANLTEATLPRSRPIAAFSVFDLLAVVRRRLWMVTVCVLTMLVLSSIYLVLQKAVYRSTVEILMDPQGLQVVGKDILPTDTSASLDFASVDSQMLIIASTGVLSEVINTLKLEQDPFFAGRNVASATAASGNSDALISNRFVRVLDNLRNNTVVHRADPSLVFQITVTHSDPIRAAEIANTIATVYLRQNRDARLTAARRANESLVAQATDLRGQFERAEHAVEQFRAENGLITTGTAGLIVNQRLQDLTSQISAATAQLSSLSARRDLARNINKAMVEAGGIPEAVASPTVAALRAQYARAAQTQAELERTLGPNHPSVQQNQSERAAIDRLIDAELSRIRDSIDIEYARARDSLAALQARSQDITQTQLASNTAEIRARELQSDADAIQQVYNSVLNRSKELDLQQQIQTNNSRVISEAIPPARSSAPPKAIVLAAGCLFGLALGIALAYALELLTSDPVSQLRKISASLGTELIGVLTVPRRKFSLFGRKKVPEEAESGDGQALLPAAQALSVHLGKWLPATVLIIESGVAANGSRVAKALGVAIADLGEEALVCSASDMSTMFRIRPSLRTGINAADDDDDVLEEGDPRIGKEYILIDGGASDSERTLSATYAYVDAVIVVATVGRGARNDLRELMASLGSLLPHMIGVVGVIDAS